MGSWGRKRMSLVSVMGGIWLGGFIIINLRIAGINCRFLCFKSSITIFKALIY